MYTVKIEYVLMDERAYIVVDEKSIRIIYGYVFTISYINMQYGTHFGVRFDEV